MANLKTRQQKLVTALSVIGRLKMNGCTVTSSNLDHGIPMIDIDTPSAKLRAKAVQVTQVKQGQVNKLCLANYGGCIVRWHNDGITNQEQVWQNLNPYSPELINSWPKCF